MKSKFSFYEHKQIHAPVILGTTVVLVAFAMVFSGCSKSSSSTQPPAAKSPKAVDASAVRAAFSSADPSVKYPLEQSIRIAEGGGFADALPQLRKIATSPELTAEQKKALDDFIQKIQNLMAQQRK